MKRIAVLGCLLVALALAVKGVDCAVCDQRVLDCNASADAQHDSCLSTADGHYDLCLSICQGDPACGSACEWDRLVEYGSCDRFYGTQQRICDRQYTQCLNSCT